MTTARIRFPLGALPGVAVGTWYPDRRALAAAGVHRQLQAGITGTGATGAEAIVLNGGYEDDLDSGDSVLSTGEGGRDPATGKQVRPQTMTKGNLALVRSHDEGLRTSAGDSRC